MFYCEQIKTAKKEVRVRVELMESWNSLGAFIFTVMFAGQR